MHDILIGAGTFFVMLTIKKAIIEPLATSIGRKVLDKHLPAACTLLDDQLEKYGLDFNPEEALRDYLDLEPESISDKERDIIIEQVFKEWDLRKAAHFKS